MKRHNGVRKVNKLDGGKGLSRKLYHKALREWGRELIEEIRSLRYEPLPSARLHPPRKAALWPGHVYSKRDGEYLFVSATQLADLYSLNLADCVVFDIRRPETLRGRLLSSYDHYFPRPDGAYHRR